MVTGSTRGIGRAIAGRLAAAGADVVVCGLDKDAAERVAEQIGGNALGMALDVRSTEQTEAFVARTVEWGGGLDIVVNNAGIALDNYLTAVTDERWNDTIDVNLTGTMRVMRAATRHMKAAGRGAVLNVVSWSGLRGNPGQAAYAASKAGQIGLTLTAAKELGRFGIRVNALAPSAPTDLTAEVPEAVRVASLATRPMPRVGTLEENAEAALFLVSDRSSFTTGQVFNVDGGMHLV